MRILIAAGLLLTVAGTPQAWAQSCDSLWYQRNAIYRQAGYCFKTIRAIRTFGNAGCAYDSEYALPLSANQRAVIGRIVNTERAYGCR